MPAKTDAALLEPFVGPWTSRAVVVAASAVADWRSVLMSR